MITRNRKIYLILILLHLISVKINAQLFGGQIKSQPFAPQYPAGSLFCNAPTAIVDVINPTTGKTWMDRNLGAAQQAANSSDPLAFGDLYQWGRRTDGHQCRNSPTTSTLSSIDQPAHSNFILSTGDYITAPYADWRSPQNNNLWQGVNGVNNPCPSGYRLPTDTEWDSERLSWSTNDNNGAFNSPLKLTGAGYRASNGLFFSGSSFGNYWSSTIISTTMSRYLRFDFLSGVVDKMTRGTGYSVRCIKN